MQQQTPPQYAAAYQGYQGYAPYQQANATSPYSVPRVAMKFQPTGAAAARQRRPRRAAPPSSSR